MIVSSLRYAAALTALAFLVTGCGAVAEAPPKETPRYPAPYLHPLDPFVTQIAGEPVPELIRDGLRRKAEQMTVRVRNLSCAGIATGSGFALTPHVLLTNRHVLAEASELEVSTWDGHSIHVDDAAVGGLVDLGAVQTREALPRQARYGPRAKQGATITVVGFPLGGPLTFSVGHVVDYVDGTRLNVPGQVMRITADVRPGNSGGPVIDSRNRVVAIVYAIEIRSGYGLAIPVSTFLHLVKVGGLEDIRPCGHQ